MTQSNQIATASITDAAEKLKEQIRNAFVEIIPPEQWKAIIEAELKVFIQPRRSKYNYNDIQPSVLAEVCEQQFRAFITEQVKALLTSEEFRAEIWRGEIASAAIKAWLTENADKLIQSTILNLAGLSAQDIINRMASMR